MRLSDQPRRLRPDRSSTKPLRKGTSAPVFGGVAAGATAAGGVELVLSAATPPEPVTVVVTVRPLWVTVVGDTSVVVVSLVTVLVSSSSCVTVRVSSSSRVTVRVDVVPGAVDVVVTVLPGAVEVTTTVVVTV